MREIDPSLRKLLPPFRSAQWVQDLWGNYGQLLRLDLTDGRSAMLKWVIPPPHDRSLSGLRKRRSYEVEWAWYRQPAATLPETCRVPECWLADGPLLLLEDLQASGFRPSRSLEPRKIRAGLRWLAAFHAHFLGAPPSGLWEQGCYWHLATRQEEWQRMPSGPLKEAAADLDSRLRSARFQTLLHGDAKPANFLWADGERAAAVDFQYVGPGCGIRDVAYFLDCCRGENGCQGELDFYFEALREDLAQRHPELDAAALEQEWRELFPVAWSDFCRFEQGWRGAFSPGAFTLRQLSLALG